MGNVKQHSRATRAEITLDFAAKDIKISVEDNGCGFVQSENMESHSTTSQMGLDIMKQRAKLLGGRLIVQSELGKGTTLTVETGLV